MNKFAFDQTFKSPHINSLLTTNFYYDLYLYFRSLQEIDMETKQAIIRPAQQEAPSWPGVMEASGTKVWNERKGNLLFRKRKKPSRSYVGESGLPFA